MTFPLKGWTLIVISAVISWLVHDVSAVETDIKTFLKKYCLQCHGSEEAEGEVRLDTLTLNIKNAKEAKLWYRVLESLQFSEMPFAGADSFPTRSESREAEMWIATALAQHGQQLEDKSGAEGYGNLVPHDLLFSPTERNRSVDVGARIWRVSPETLRSKLSAASRFNFTTNPFDFDKPLGNFSDFKGKYPLNEIMAEQVTELAIRAAENQTKDGVAEKTIAGHIDRGATKREAIEHMLIQQYQNVLRRTPSNEELSLLLTLLDRIDKQLGEPYGLQAAYASILLKPETIFRFEGAVAKADANGLLQLSSRELAHSLAYALTDRPPERELLALFESSNSSVSETLQMQAERLMQDNRYAPQRLLQFFQEYFDYEKANDIFKDKIPKHMHWAPGLVHDLDVLIQHVLEKDEQVLHTLLTTSDMYVLFYSHKERGNQLTFNLPPDFKKTTRPVSFPKDQRMGVLTHPAWLVAHSSNFDNDPIRRGHWIRYKLLGGIIPDIPITVEAKLPDEPTWTLRQRMHVTRVSECYKCHSKMNPLGLPFEQFDHYGRYRFDELKTPVETRGGVFNSGVAKLDGEVKTPFELIERLANSEHVEQVFVRHVFRFFLGRNETLGDAKTLQDAYRAYVENNGSMKSLVISLMSSDSFIYRKDVGSPVVK